MWIHVIIGAVFLALAALSVREDLPDGMPVWEKPFARMGYFLGRLIPVFGGLPPRVRAQFLLTVFAGNLLGAALVWNYQHDVQEEVAQYRLQKPDRQEEAAEESLQVHIEGSDQKQTVQVEVPQVGYAKAQLEELLSQLKGQLGKEVLGENASLSAVEHDLHLPSAVDGYPFVLSWNTSRSDLLSWEGELLDGIPPEGETVTLTADIACSADQSVTGQWSCVATVFPRAISEKEAWENRIRETVRELNQDSPQEEKLKLPDEVDGKKVTWSAPPTFLGAAALGGSLILGVLLTAGRYRDRENMRQKRQKQMLLDYPEIVSTLTLLLSAGLSMRRAFARIALDYQKKLQTATKRKDPHRYAYDEILTAYREMEGGVSEAEAYENFGQRCDEPRYKTLATYLIQNLRKGTKGMIDLLDREAVEAFEERKRTARVCGEEAGTRLLFPMFLMLLDVLIIIMLPAFLSM